ncbi:MAG: hypothetical protein ABJA71_11815 [Ginsengibacter sp.]
MKRKVRLIFVLVILIFIIELVITIKFEQPYPAILFPSFANIPNVSKPIKKPRIKIFFYNQDSLEIKIADLFYNLSDIFSGEILRENFTKENSFLVPLKKQKKFDFNIGLHHIQGNIRDIRDTKQIEKGVIWIKKRVTDMVKRTDLNRLEIQWYLYIFNSKNNQMRDSLVEKFNIDLN